MSKYHESNVSTQEHEIGNGPYRLLIVDDEKFAAGVIAHCVNWKSLGFTVVEEAYSIPSAMEKLEQNAADVVICDIEMPGKSGLDLLRWIRIAMPQTETIMLTGHAYFHYVQQAIQLGGFDYLLKPVEPDQLVQTVLGALEKIAHHHEINNLHLAYQRYAGRWNIQRPLLVERFWQDLISGRGLTSPEAITRTFRQLDLKLQLTDFIQAILLETDDRPEGFDAHDEDLLRFALRNVAAEHLMASNDGVVLQDHEGRDLVLLYLFEPDSFMDQEPLCEETRRKLDALVKTVEDLLHIRLNYRMSPFVPISGLRSAIEQLDPQPASVPEPAGGRVQLVRNTSCEQDWDLLLSSGQTDRFLESLRFRQNELHVLDTEAAYREALLLELASAIARVLQRSGVAMQDISALLNTREGLTAVTDPDRFDAWLNAMGAKAADWICRHRGTQSAVIRKAKEFILENLQRDFSRDDIAAHVYLNPVYLSRLFRKETGASLSEYILEERINAARKLLETTNLRISDIAERLTYCQLSHFTKMFHRTVGMPPQEYRRRFQSLN